VFNSASRNGAFMKQADDTSVETRTKIAETPTERLDAPTNGRPDNFLESPYFKAIRTTIAEDQEERHGLTEPLPQVRLDLPGEPDTRVSETTLKLYAAVDECLAAMARIPWRDEEPKASENTPSIRPGAPRES
jgi:hypothetical protein